MSEKPRSYQAYLLRLWRVVEAREAWRASLEDAHTHELRGFASLEDLVKFLDAQTLPPDSESEAAPVETKVAMTKKPKTGDG